MIIGHSVTTPVLDPAEIKLHLMKLHSALSNRINSADPDSVRFTRSCIREIAKIRGTQFIDTQYECLETCIPYLYASGNLVAALVAALLMSKLAARSGRKEWIRKAHNFLGIVQVEMGDVSSGIVEYHHSLSMAEELGDTTGIASTLLNLGAAFHYGALSRDGIACLYRALELAPSTSCPQHYAFAALGTLAQICKRG
jgi:hypothetical protein